MGFVSQEDFSENEIRKNGDLWDFKEILKVLNVRVNNDNCHW